MNMKTPYTNFHELNQDWIIKTLKKMFSPDNPPPYPVESVNGQTGEVVLTGEDIDISEKNQTSIKAFCDALLMAIQAKYTLPSTGLPWDDLAQAVKDIINAKYNLPSGGIPWSDLSTGVKNTINNKYTLPANGIPMSQLDSNVSGLIYGAIQANGSQGSNGQIPVSNGSYSVWTNPGDIPSLASAIATAVNTWLTANITNPSSPPLDRSLTQDTAAAPADMVGNLTNDVIRNRNFVFSANNEIQSIQYSVYKVENGVLNKYANPSGYWKSMFVPVDCLYIDGIATLKTGGLSGNQSQGIPSMAFIDENFNVLSAEYTSISAPHTFSRSDAPTNASYVVCQFSLNFTFSFQSMGDVAIYCKEAVNVSTELTGNDVTLTYQSATGYYNKNKGFATYAGVTTAKISVLEGEQYLLDSRSYYDAAIACLLDASDVVQSTVWISNNTAQQRNILIEIPSGIAYLLIQRLYNYKPTILKKVTGIKAKSIQSILNGKRITVIGDSITELNLRADTNWPLWINEWANATIQNLGKSGTGFIAGGTNNYASRIASISNPDIIGVACSFNDMGNSIADLTTEAESFFDNLITAYPTTPIICYVQSPWSSYHYGISASDYWIDALKDICNTRGIPFYDGMYKGTVLKPWLAANRAVYYINDGDGNTGEEDWVHPNSEGHKAIARYLYPLFVENLVATGLDYFV